MLRDTDKSEFARLYRQGVTTTVIAKQYNCSPTTVCAYLHYAGEPIRSFSESHRSGSNAQHGSEHRLWKSAAHNCGYCGTKIWVCPSREKNSATGIFFCSRRCTNLWKRGTNSPNWKGGGGHKAQALRQLYRLSVADYTAILQLQAGKCAIADCHREPKTVDHDHTCCPGRKTCGQCVRGILCRTHNMLLGFLEAPGEIARCLEYVQRNRSRG